MIGDGSVTHEQFARRFTPAAANAVKIDTAERAAAQLADELRGLDREHCLVAGMDTQHRAIGFAVVSIGSVAHTFMSPREVYRDAIAMGASKIIVAHNHPSGDLTPSPSDIAVTRRLARTGELVGIPMLDHLIMGGVEWVSMARQGLVPTDTHQTAALDLLGELPAHVPATAPPASSPTNSTPVPTVPVPVRAVLG